MINILILIISLINSEPGVIECGNYKVQIPLEGTCKPSERRYVEGVFYDFVFEDFSSISIHCGSNVVLPLQGDKTKGDTLEINHQKLVRYTGKVAYDDVRQSGFYVEDYYLDPKLTVLIEYKSDSSMSYGYIKNIVVEKL